jgi:hypothetical protein
MNYVALAILWIVQTRIRSTPPENLIASALSLLRRLSSCNAAGVAKPAVTFHGISRIPARMIANDLVNMFPPDM